MTRMLRKQKEFRKSDVKEMLVKGEEVVLEAQISTYIYWKAFVVLVLAVLVALFIVIELGVLLAVVSLLMFVHATLLKEILMFVLTNKRISVRYGILQVDVVDMRFDKIESIELERMVPGYMMGYANLVVMGVGQRYLVVPFVENARELRRAYNDMVIGEDGLGDQSS